MNSDLGLIDALEPVARMLRLQDIAFYVGGSVASSFHGAARSTLDVDVVAKLNSGDIASAVQWS